MAIPKTRSRAATVVAPSGADPTGKNDGSGRCPARNISARVPAPVADPLGPTGNAPHLLAQAAVPDIEVDLERTQSAWSAAGQVESHCPAGQNGHGSFADRAIGQQQQRLQRRATRRHVDVEIRLWFAILPRPCRGSGMHQLRERNRVEPRGAHRSVAGCGDPFPRLRRTGCWQPSPAVHCRWFAVDRLAPKASCGCVGAVPRPGCSWCRRLRSSPTTASN